MPDRWWTSFNDPELSLMIDSALASNFTLLSIWDQLAASRAIVDRESSYLLPDIETFLRGGIQQPQPDFVGGEDIQLGLSATYEIDLWGRIGASIDAERYRARATYLDYKTAAISLSAEITRTWYRLMAAHSQLQLIDQQIANNERILELLNSRYGSGQIRGVDILRQRELLESTREQKIVAENEIRLLENQLAVLSGESPQQLPAYETDSLPALAPLPQTGVPIDLVERRPDVQSAFNLLQAADREVAAAISNRYPRLSISASTAIRSNNIDNIFQTWARSVAGNLMAPLFYGGRLKAEVDRTKAVKQQYLHEYGQTVLTAFREVEDALTQEQKQKERIATLEKRLELTNQTYEQLRIEYFNGMGNYLDVLTELNRQQELRRDIIEARLLLVEFRIGLYRALAGGFETPMESAEGN